MVTFTQKKKREKKACNINGQSYNTMQHIKGKAGCYHMHILHLTYVSRYSYWPSSY